MSDYWTVNGTETDGLEGAQTGLIPGETVDYPFIFVPRPDWDDPTDDHIDRYETILSLTKSAGTFDTYESINSDWHWREQTTPSPLVHIVPPDDDPTARTVWGLIDGYEDATTLADRRCALSLSVLIVSIGDEFTSESEIRNSREEKGP